MLTRMFVAVAAIVALTGFSFNDYFSNFFADNIEIKGNTSGFGRLKKDRYVDFALVMPAISRDQIIFLDLASLISPEIDTIKVPMSSLDVPSNLTFPRQRESYVLPITLNKPGYRFYVSKPGSYKMVATHGKFPLKKVIDDVRGGKSMFEVINYFQFIQGGFKDVEATSSVSGQDLDVSQVAFNKTLTINAPKFDRGMAAISIALQSYGNLLAPTDLKNLSSGKPQSLKTSSQEGQRFVATLMRKNDILVTTADIHREFKLQGDDVNFNEMTMALQAESELSSAPVFLPMIEMPEKTDTGLKLFPPSSSPEGVAAVGTYIALETIEEARSDRSMDTVTRVWEQTYDEWVTFIKYPALNLPKPLKKHRWVVMFLGQNKDTIKNPDELNLSEITHVSRNALDVN